MTLAGRGQLLAVQDQLRRRGSASCRMGPSAVAVQVSCLQYRVSCLQDGIQLVSTDQHTSVWGSARAACSPSERCQDKVTQCLSHLPACVRLCRFASSLTVHVLEGQGMLQAYCPPAAAAARGSGSDTAGSRAGRQHPAAAVYVKVYARCTGGDEVFYK